MVDHFFPNAFLFFHGNTCGELESCRFLPLRVVQSRYGGTRFPEFSLPIASHGWAFVCRKNLVSVALRMRAFRYRRELLVSMHRVTTGRNFWYVFI